MSVSDQPFEELGWERKDTGDSRSEGDFKKGRWEPALWG